MVLERRQIALRLGCISLSADSMDAKLSFRIEVHVCSARHTHRFGYESIALQKQLGSRVTYKLLFFSAITGVWARFFFFDFKLLLIPNES